jgi:pimeloyl-ACP methyl ester carboxylesterase
VYARFPARPPPVWTGCQPAELLQALQVVMCGDALLSPAVTRRPVSEFVARPPEAVAAGPVGPMIRYCNTPSGRVAYSTMGAGPPLLFDSGWTTHLQRQLQLFSFGEFVRRLAEHFTVIRYDNPGCGLSDRDADLSFEGQVTAALAAADAAGAEHFRIFGASQGGQVAAAIAAMHPDRVEALVVYGTCASGSDLAPAEVRESIVALVRAHWGLGLKALTGAFVTDPTAEDVAAFTDAQRACASAAVAARLLEV